MQRAACYIRVSTDDQLEFSPDAQLRAIKKYAKINHIILDTKFIFIDAGISGRKANRPAFQEMIKQAKIKPKQFDVILVHKFDRFARSREDSVVYKSLLKKECNIKVVSITEKLEDDKFSIILEAILEAMAEYYSLNLADEVKKGMSEKARKGEFQSSPPFGYTIKKGNLVIIPNEAKIIKLIFKKFINGNKYSKIANEINNLGYKTHRNNLFTSRTIKYILTNPIYYGYTRWNPNGSASKSGLYKKTKETIITKSNHEPIISKSTFYKANKKIK